MYCFLYAFLLLFHILNAQEAIQPLSDSVADEPKGASPDAPLPETITLCVSDVLSGADDAPICFSGQSSLPLGPQLPIDFFFHTLYAEIQKSNFGHATIPYNFLVERPGIKLSFAQTAMGESVSIEDERSPGRSTIIGCIPQYADKNYITLNEETRYNPQIKNLYTMFLKRESEKLLLSEEVRQEALGDLLRCREVGVLYLKVGQMTTSYYEVNELLFKWDVPVVTENVRRLIADNMEQGRNYPPHILAQNYLAQYYGHPWALSETTAEGASFDTPPPYGPPPPYMPLP